MVLNDGETYTPLAGCKIVTVEFWGSGDDPIDDSNLDYAIKHGHPDVVTVTKFTD